MSRLDRAAFLSKAALKRKDVELPEMGTVSVRELSADEVGQYLKLQQTSDDEVGKMAWVFVRVVCDENGKPMFSESDVPAVRQMGLSVLRTTTDEAGRLSGIVADDEAKKNDAANSQNPATASPSSSAAR